VFGRGGEGGGRDYPFLPCVGQSLKFLARIKRIVDEKIGYPTFSYINNKI